MEREGQGKTERGLSGVARSQNVVHVLPHDAAAVAQFMATALERVDAESAGVQLLVATTDTEVAGDVARAAALAPAPAPAVAVTGLRRASRRLRTGAPAVVAGTPADLLELVRESVLKLDAVRTVIVAWADALLERGEGEALEGLLAELPREAARVVVTSRSTPDVEELIERYARRARRTGDVVPAEALAPLSLRVMSVPVSARASAVRRLLDAVDPESAALVARSEPGARETAELARSLGGPSAEVRAARDASEAEGVELVVLYELPATREELRALAAVGRTTVALVQPRQLHALRAMAGGAGALRPMSLPEAGARARAREAEARTALRAILAHEPPAREMLALEPLLEEYDGVEIAAAALRLLEREREERSRSDRAREERASAELAREERSRADEQREPEAAPGGSARGTARERGTTRGGSAGRDETTARLFVSAGARDGIGPGDLVGAIANEARIRGERIGRVEVRDTHSLVEVPAGEAEAIARALTGLTMRGRRLSARVDRERTTYDRQPRDGAPRERPGRERPGRERPASGARPERGGRPTTRGARPRGDWAAREERGSWSERGGRGGRPERGERPERGARTFARRSHPPHRD